MGKFEELKRLRDAAAESIKDAESRSKAIKTTRAVVESAAGEAKVVNRKGEVSTWRVAKAAVRPTKTGRRLVKGALAGASAAASATTGPKMSGAPASWYPDPHGRFQHRYWNGESWTADVATDGESSTDPHWTHDNSAEPEYASDQMETASASSISNTFIGRKFSSSLGLDECLRNFSEAARECYQTVGVLEEIEWHSVSNVIGVESTQGGPPAVPPARFVAQDLTEGGRLYLAVWDGYVWNGRDGVSGQTREMWFVPPGFDNSPIPIAGIWKGLDASLSSIGTVESAFWGG